MRRATTKNRWITPHRHYTGTWRQNPWINATSSGPQGRGEIADDNQDRQQKAAIRNWEDEGGSIRTDGNVRR